MKVVVQEDAFGCAIACVACILSTTYKEAGAIFPQGHLKIKGYSCNDIVHALKKANQNYKFKHVKRGSLGNVPFGSIVYIKKSYDHPAGHFLAKTDKGWMDPWINFTTLPAKAGFREKLPGAPQYLIFPTRG